jgi:hypothetical protein
VEDAAGDIWAGTDAAMIKLNRRGFITYDDEDSPGLGKVHRI